MMVRIDRLEQVIQALMVTPDEEFDMSVWWCKSAGCAVGNYIKHFPECGLKLIPDSMSGNVVDNGGFPAPYAVLEHFGISYRNYEILLYSHNYSQPVTRQAVISRIRDFIEKLEPSAAV